MFTSIYIYIGVAHKAKQRRNKSVVPPTHETVDNVSGDRGAREVYPGTVETALPAVQDDRIGSTALVVHNDQEAGSQENIDAQCKEATVGGTIEVVLGCPSPIGSQEGTPEGVSLQKDNPIPLITCEDQVASQDPLATVTAFYEIRQVDAALVGTFTPVTKRSGKQPLKCLGFSMDFIHNERMGKNPNLWIVWRDSLSKPVVYSTSNQQVTVFMDVRGEKNFLSTVHASNFRALRRDLWVDLLSEPISALPWIVLGDFNVTVLASEKRGPSAFHIGSAMDFAAFLDSSSVLPLPSKGNKFTWSNSRKGGNATAVLDRSFCNPAWLDRYHDAYQWVLLMFVSDHSPIVIFSDSVPKPVNCPFQVATFLKLKRLKVNLRAWSRSAFPNVNIEVDRARAALQDAQEVMETVGSTEYLILCESQAKQEYINAITLQEKLWSEKSRVRVLTYGDRNTRFFHLVTKIRCSKNLIQVLKKADGTVLNDGPQISTYITEFYEAFHKRVTIEAQPEILSCIPTVISKDDNDFLTAVLSREEIKVATFDLDPDSAPSPDGFPGAFYRSCWDIIERAMCRAISNFFIDGIITKGVNSNFITLIPKVEEAIALDKFRPICVGNFLYKLIPKILATRLSGFLPTLILEEQGAFQKGKVIFSNICVASELTNSLHVKSYGGGMGLKLDIQKAYDTMEWEFMFDVMKKFGFNNRWVNMIHQLLSSARLSILLNGGPVGFFGVDRGL
ncbi:uncharacterized protein LOC122655174 [Telopea speciosissima]|uniref:uncharacterized protein LOC122655174 n=1 Tax=Telopea speciosissima TaxID=54955 RepID=UPI001CC71276|nr:uncharacterized protein LOC122655174 [Telopea speciosissima]